MAYDKVVDSSVLDAGLKQIADAIREKAGTSGNLVFPTAMAEAIAAIQSGGAKIELSELIPASNINKASPLTVNHTLGVIPDFVCVLAETYPAASSNGISFACGLLCPRWVTPTDGYKNKAHYASAFRTSSSYNNGCGQINSSATTLKSFLSNYGVPVSDMTENTITMCGVGDKSGANLLAGSKYFLIVGAIVDE